MRRRAARSNWRRNRRMFRRFSVWSASSVCSRGRAWDWRVALQNTPAKPVRANTNPQFNIERHSNIARLPAPRPSVILITIDTLRADHVGCYGAQIVKTPTLDALAHDGIVFERAISQVPLTWPSHAVILTGTYPFQNGVQDFTGQPLLHSFDP